MKQAVFILLLTVAAAFVWSVLFAGQSRETELPMGIDVKSARLSDSTELNRQVIVGSVSQGPVVSYAYLGESLPESLATNEVRELRTPNSYTRYEGVLAEGADPIIRLNTILYPQPQFYQNELGVWHYLEYATSTTVSWEERHPSWLTMVRELIIATAYADSIAPFSGAGDGYVAFSTDTSNWASCVNEFSGSASDSTSIIATALSFRSTGGESGNCEIDRIFLPFDTSSIPSNSAVSAASLSVYVTAKADGDDDPQGYLTAIGNTTQASETSLALGDYSQTSTTELTDSGERKDITSISTSAYMTYTFNATGMSAVVFSGQASACGVTAGYTCIGLREGHDNAASAIGDNLTNSVTISTSEHTGTSQDPYLSVTYSIVASVALPSGMKVGAYGSLKVTGGGIKIK